MTSTVAQLFIDRKDGANGHEGVLTLQWADGKPMVKQTAFKSGQAKHGASSWLVGKSPIPFTHQVSSGEMWLHLEQMNKNGEPKPVSDKAAGIGWFIPISSSEGDPWVIVGRDGRRTAIGLHPENGIPGSAGCPVVQHRTLPEKVNCDKLFYALERLRLEGVKRIPVHVV